MLTTESPWWTLLDTMTMVVERTPRLNASSSSREVDQFEDSFSIRSKFVLSAPFSELREETFNFVNSVLLCLTIEGDLLVLKKTTSDKSPTRFSLVRKHQIENSQVMEHPLLPDALRVQAAGTVLVHVYQAVKDSTQSCIKKWVRKLNDCKLAKAKAKKRSAAAATNTHSSNSTGSRAAKNGFLGGTKPKKPTSTAAEKTTISSGVSSTLSPASCSQNRHYSSPSSPVLEHRSILSTVRRSSRERRRPESILLEEEPTFVEKKQLPCEEEKQASSASAVNTTTVAIEEKLAASVDPDESDDRGSCCDIDDVVIITNGHCCDDIDDGDATVSPSTEAAKFTISATIEEDAEGEALTLVNGHTDLVNGVETENVEILVQEEEEKKTSELSRNAFSLDLLRELRSSFRLDLASKRSQDITRTASDRYLGYHRALSAIEEGTMMMKTYPGSASASRLDKLRDTTQSLSVSFEERNGYLCVNGGDAADETRSHGSSTPSSPPLTPVTPRTPSPLMPAVPENDGFLRGRAHLTQIRRGKVKCSPRISRSISVQTPPPPSDSAVAPEKTTRSASLVAVALTNGPLMATTPSRNADISNQRSATPTHAGSGSSSSTSPLALSSSSSPKHPSGCSTLPRNHKTNKLARPPSAPAPSINSTTDPNQGSMGQFPPSSPLPASKLLPAKSPRLLRIFHRRWQSSSAIKVPLNLDDPLPSPSGSIPSTPVHGSSAPLPKKLHLYSSREVAEELCVIDGELLRNIDPEELSNGAWMKKNKDSLAPNVIAMIQSFNQLALLVPSEILEETTPQARAKVITSYIQIASKCHRLHNYNSLKAVLAGLQCTPIFRLKKTWKEVSSKKRKRFDQLSELMSEEDNCRVYQTEIEKLLKSDTSFIPFLGSFLTQVVHQVSYDEIRAKREKSKASTASILSTTGSEASQPTSPSRQVVLREATGVEVEVPNLTNAAVRRRSCSLTSGGTAVNSTAALLLEQLNEEKEINLSRSAPSSPVPSHRGSPLDCERKSSSSSTDGSLHGLSSTATAASVLASSIDAMTKNIISCEGDDEPDWAGRSENSLADHDSGLYSSSSHRSTSLPKSSSLSSLRHDTDDEEGERCSSAAALAGDSEVDLKDIYLRRKSQSYESLLDAYTEEDTGLKKVLHSTLTELARLSANLDGDSVFSESDDTGENDTSSINLDLTFSDQCSETSLHHSSFDASASSNSHMIQELRAALDKDNETTTTTVTELIAKRRRPKLLRAQSEQTSLEAKLKNLERLEKAQEVEEAGRESENELQSRSEVMDDSQEGKREKEEKKKRPVRRSLSYSKAVLKRRRRKKSSSVCEDQSVVTSDAEKSTAAESSSPAEMLNRFKTASRGYSLELESRSALRSLIRDTQPNTERDNYKLSVDREQ